MLTSLFRHTIKKPGRPVVLSSHEFNRLMHQARRLGPLWNAAPHASSRQSGECLSSMVGQGMEFEEVRDQGADADLRHLDWRATARTGRPHVRVYREEYGTDLHIAMDAGPSMWFGTRVRLKYTQALRMAALYAFANPYWVDGSLLTGKIVQIEGGLGEIGASRALGQLNQSGIARHNTIQHQPPPDLNALLRHLLANLTSSGRLIIFSDFVGFDVQSKALIYALGEKHSIIAVQCYDAVEQSLSRIGVARFRDLNSGKLAHINTNDQTVRDRYEQDWKSLQKGVATAVRKCGGEFLAVESSIDLVSLMHRNVQMASGDHR